MRFLGLRILVALFFPLYLAISYVNYHYNGVLLTNSPIFGTEYVVAFALEIPLVF